MIIRDFLGRFSIRLGTIIVGSAFLVEAVIGFFYHLLWLQREEGPTSRPPTTVFPTINIFEGQGERLGRLTDILLGVPADGASLSPLSITMSAVKIVSDSLVIVGAYYMKPFLLIPFLATNVVFIGFLLLVHITAMQVVNDTTQDFMLLILLTFLGTLILCFLMYCCMCVFSLYKVLRRIQSRGASSKTVVVHPSLSLAKYHQEYPPVLYPAYPTPYHNPIAPVY